MCERACLTEHTVETELLEAHKLLDELGYPRDDQHKGEDGLGGALYALRGRIQLLADDQQFWKLNLLHAIRETKHNRNIWAWDPRYDHL